MGDVDYRIGHLELVSPWGNAGGVVKTVEDVEKMARTGVGFIEDGSQTLERRLGNQRDAKTGELIPDPDTGQPIRVYFHDPVSGETFNSLGMPGKGMDVVEKEIPEKVRICQAYGKKYIQNVAPVTSNPVEETLELVTRSYEAGAHAVLVNAGCPNVITPDGSRHEKLSKNPDAFKKVLIGLRPIVEKFFPVFVRISPQDSFVDMIQLVRAVSESGTVSAIFVPNTFDVQLPLDENGKPVLGVKGGTGGKSGPATAREAAIQTEWLIKLLHGSNIDVVSSGGIMDARGLKRQLSLGAVAGAGTTFYYEATRGWEEETDRLLHDLAK